MMRATLHTTAPATVPRAHRSRLRVLAVVLLALLATVVAVAAGWTIRGGAGADAVAPPAPPRAVELGALRLAVDGAWRPAPPPPGFGGLDPATSAVFEPEAGIPARVVLTFAPAADASLLPPVLRAAAGDALTAPRRTDLLGLPAWRYPEQAIQGGRVMEVTLVPTSAGTLAVACVVGDATWSTALWCSAGLRALSLGDARPMRPAAGLALRSAVPAAIERLAAKRTALRARLAGATTRRGQAMLSRRIGAAYARAAERLAPLAPAQAAGEPATALAGRLRSVARSYRKLSLAARSNRPPAFDRARRAVRAGEAQVKATLATLR
jgi:hypothetical protein